MSSQNVRYKTFSSPKFPDAFSLASTPRDYCYSNFFHNRLVLLVLEFNINGIIQHTIFYVRLSSLRITLCNSSILLHALRIHYFLLQVVSHKICPRLFFMLLMEIKLVSRFLDIINKATITIPVQLFRNKVFSFTGKQLKSGLLSHQGYVYFVLHKTIKIFF